MDTLEAVAREMADALVGYTTGQALTQTAARALVKRYWALQPDGDEKEWEPVPVPDDTPVFAMPGVPWMVAG